MKRKGYLFERICSMENLLQAFQNASNGKRKRDEVKRFEADLDTNLRQLQVELTTRTYTTSAYEVFVKYEPKRREIYKLPFRDRVVQWAIMQVLEPVWTPQFTSDTHACIRGRGIHSLLRQLRTDLRRDPDGTRYCLKIDVRKFYPSIDHGILKQVIRRKLKDPDVLWLLDGIIDSASGVPIGNYISQYFANLYLSELDHLLKEDVGVRYYYRYADDIVLLSDSKEYLSGVLVYINHYLNDSRLLTLKSNFQIYPVESRGIDFVGYVTYHTHCLARKRNKQGLCRELAALRKKGLPDEEIRLRVASRMGFMKHCDSNHLLKILGMKKFSDIKPKQGKLTGGKYHIDTILNREIHITAFDVSQSKYDGEMLTLQYEIYEQMEDEQGKVIDDEGNPVMAWIKHITFTGSKALIRQLDGVELTEPVAAKIIKQPIGTDGKRCFYSIVDPDQ
jgi:retron-type reverse transcriptase|nr:MAG TPA: hypothetical protein [Caudoviricetes sp.]